MCQLCKKEAFCDCEQEFECMHLFTRKADLGELQCLECGDQFGDC
jgi:hypothetical protein